MTMVDNVKRINDLILKENFEDGPEAGYYIHDMTKPDDPEAPMDNMIGPMAELDEVIDYQWRQPPEKTKWAGLFYYDDGWYFVFPVMEDGVMVDIDLVRSSRSGLNVSKDKMRRATSEVHKLLGPNRMFDAGVVFQKLHDALSYE